MLVDVRIGMMDYFGVDRMKSHEQKRARSMSSDVYGLDIKLQASLVTICYITAQCMIQTTYRVVASPNVTCFMKRVRVYLIFNQYIKPERVELVPRSYWCHMKSLHLQIGSGSCQTSATHSASQCRY